MSAKLRSSVHSVGSQKRPRKLLAVDGYNVLRAGFYYQEMQEHMPDYGDEHLNTTREALIDDARLLAGRDYDVLVVFDGGGNRFSEGEPSYSGAVEVVFSGYGVSADSVIEERVKKAVAAGREVLVVTSDATMQWTVLGGSVSRMSAMSFCSEVSSLKAERKSDEAAVNPRMTLGERLSPEARQRLSQLTSGLDNGPTSGPTGRPTSGSTSGPTGRPTSGQDSNGSHQATR